jgi:hypothetical protein
VSNSPEQKQGQVLEAQKLPPKGKMSRTPGRAASGPRPSEMEGGSPNTRVGPGRSLAEENLLQGNRVLSGGLALLLSGVQLHRFILETCCGL